MFIYIYINIHIYVVINYINIVLNKLTQPSKSAYEGAELSNHEAIYLEKLVKQKGKAERTSMWIQNMQLAARPNTCVYI